MKTLNIPLDDKQYKKFADTKKEYERTNGRVNNQKFIALMLKSFEGEC